MKDGVPLVVPEVNPEQIHKHNGLIANRLTGKCIEVFSTADFAGVYQNTCSGAPGQKWWW